MDLERLLQLIVFLSKKRSGWMYGMWLKNEYSRKMLSRVLLMLLVFLFCPLKPYINQYYKTCTLFNIYSSFIEVINVLYFVIITEIFYCLFLFRRKASSHKKNWTHFNFYKVPSSLTSSEYGGRLEEEIEEMDDVDEEPLIVDILSVEFEEL